MLETTKSKFIEEGACTFRKRSGEKRSPRDRLDHARMRPLIRYIDAPISKRIGGTMSYISDAKSRGVLSPLSEISDGPNRHPWFASNLSRERHLRFRPFCRAENGSHCEKLISTLGKTIFRIFRIRKKKICYWNWVKKSHRYLSQNPRIFYSKNVASKRYILKATTVNH